MKSRLMSVANYFIIPLFGMVTLLSILIVLISTPPIWNLIYAKSMPQNMHQNFREDAQQISGAIWTSDSYDDVNKELHVSRIRKLPILGTKEVKHFEDVRSLVHFFPYISLLGIIILSVWRLRLRQKIKWHFSLGIFLITAGTLAIWGSIAWRHMFRTLHWWIFQDDSWILPKNCYSLLLFPYSVWQAASITVITTLFIFLTGLSIPRFINLLKKSKEAI